MKRQLLLFIFFLLPTFLRCQPYEADTVLLLMGSRYELVAVHEDKMLAQESLNKGIEEIQRIESLISSWNSNSQTSRVNQNAGIKPVRVDEELFLLIERCKKVSKLTNGTFDITFGPLGDLWDVNQPKKSLPDTIEVIAAKELVNYENIILDREKQTVFLENSGMKIGFGAIGKGYSANRAKSIMVEMGIRNGMVNAGGDLTVWGKQKDGKSWQIGIADPNKKEKYIAWLELSEMSVVTSGNYEKYIEIGGKRYSHIIDPRSGYPSEGVKSVTIVSPDAELSDALATSLFVLGIEGIKLIDRIKNVECLLIDDKGKLHQSKGMNINYY